MSCGGRHGKRARVRGFSPNHPNLRTCLNAWSSVVALFERSCHPSIGFQNGSSGAWQVGLEMFSMFLDASSVFCLLV